MRVALLLIVGLSLWTAAVGPIRADTVRVAVAANFLGTAQTLADVFEHETGLQVEFVPGSTGKLFAQIVEQAPFDVFLSSDQARASEVGNHRPVFGQQTYAEGRLALYSLSGTSDLMAKLKAADFRSLAVADPQLAPYGFAASEVLAALDLTEKTKDKLVIGQSIGQTFAFIATGNAELGFVALSQIKTTRDGQGVEIDPSLYSPIRQDAVLLTEENASVAFFDFLFSDPARGIITEAGYGVSAR